LLDEADFHGAKLGHSLFGCAVSGPIKLVGPFPPGLRCTWLRRAFFSRAQLQGAQLAFAQLQGAWLDAAQLQGAKLNFAQLQGATLDGAQLQGATLDGAQLQGASLQSANLQGARFLEAKLQGASLFAARLQGAWFADARLQGAELDWAQLRGASLTATQVWHARGHPNLDLAVLSKIDADTAPWKKPETFGEWRTSVVNVVFPPGPLSAGASWRRDRLMEALARLDPAAEKQSEKLLDSNFWKQAQSSQPQEEDFWSKRSELLADLGCSAGSGLYVARGLIGNLEFNDYLQPDATKFGRERMRQLFINRLHKGRSDPAACPGVKGFTDEDWANLSKLSPDSRPDRDEKGEEKWR